MVPGNDLTRVFNDLVRFETELWDALDRRMREGFGIPFGNVDIMRVIARIPSCRVHDIARELSITVGGTSKAVDRIEALGHCLRRSNPGDRRSSIIELTPAGTALLAEASAAFEAELEVRLRAPLSEGALTDLGLALAQLRSALRANPA
jgi:DNA-binding MarR family transcriptional regulator